MGYFKFAKYFSLCLSTFLLSLPLKCHADLASDRASLLDFMTGISSDPQRALDSWNSSNTHLCNWTGITCNEGQDRVVKLDLDRRFLGGVISSSLGNLKSLSILDLSGNFFHGRIPTELGSLLGLTQISLASNLLEGEIPSELGRLNQLNYLHLGSNKLVGRIPESLFCNLSSSLEYLDLSNNSIEGEIPYNDGCELRELRFLLLWSNRLSGHVPLGLANSTKLEWIDLESNKLTGELPSQILRKMPLLKFVYLSYNDFVSHDGNTNLEPFFASLVNASRLQELGLEGNNLGGKIPPIIGDLQTNLEQIHLDDNLIYGSIPWEISNLSNLTLLNLSTNLLYGSIPTELSRLKRLERLYLANNSLSGEIPSTLGDIPHLGLLDLSRNKLSGSIPKSFANLSQLRWLLLYENQLSGPIPPSLGNCINLEILDLSKNHISGTIPREVAGLNSLKLYLNLSSNHLSGPIPVELSKMEMVLSIDLSMNNLSSTIPSQLGSCIALEFLNLSSNHFEGLLPASIGQLPYLQSLDVSMNQLVGVIPDSFESSSTLNQLNFSFNNFFGYVPNNGVFSMLDINSFSGNSGLCGTIKGMRDCHHKRRLNHHLMVLSILISAFCVTLLCIFCKHLVHKSRKYRGGHLGIYNEEETEATCSEKQERKDHPKYPRISHQQLTEATGGFNPLSLIGSGRFGHVYKGTLEDNTKIAVKVLDCRSRAVSGSFKRECRVLKNTRHRNLIRIITICSTPDFKAIVLPLMSNGSLERHLYPSHGLDLGQMIRICGDVAEGMAYLHHYAPVRVVHCDLKPSNILLDDEMNALLTDFGIAKLVKGGDHEGTHTLSPHESAEYFSSTDGLLCGSVGYIAPEYGLGKRASTQGDVYSFGVLLLEIVTGKRPTEVLVEEGSSLHEWVKNHYPHNLDAMIERALLRSPPPRATDEKAVEWQLWHDVVSELIELGLMCTQYSASTRPTMLDVAQEMQRLKQSISN